MRFKGFEIDIEIVTNVMFMKFIVHCFWWDALTDHPPQLTVEGTYMFLVLLVCFYRHLLEIAQSFVVLQIK